MKHILVLAEDAAVRQTKKLVLEQLGFAVVAVATVREVDHVSGITKFDLAILGRTVSDPHKREAAKSLRTRQPETPVLGMATHCRSTKVVRRVVGKKRTGRAA